MSDIEENIKGKTISAMLWGGVQRFGTMSITFIVNIILARILLPEDFGIVGILLIFIEVSNSLVDAGFGAALIQKNNPSRVDCSTVFFLNLGISLVLYIVLFFSSPFIAIFFNIPLLSSVLRVEAIILIISAFSFVQLNLLMKKLDFKSLALIQLTANIISAIIAIVLAYNDFGVWSLVVKFVLLSFIQGILLWIFSDWKPEKVFSIQSLKELFNFGSMIFLSNLIQRFYNNFESIIIGRIFTAKDLGYYTQAKRTQQLPVLGLSLIVNQVTFPVFSKMKDDLESLITNFRKNLQSISFIVFPLMIYLILAAYPLFVFIYTEKWESSVLYFQILCIAGMFFPLTTIYENIYKAVGKANFYFYLQLTRVILGLLSIVVGLNFGIKGLVWGITCSTVLYYIVNVILSNKIFKYKFYKQFIDIFPSFLVSIVTGVIVYFINKQLNFQINIIIIIEKLLLYISLYLILTFLFKVKGFNIYYSILKQRNKLIK